MNTTLAKSKPVHFSADKIITRSVYNVMQRWNTTSSQDIHEVVIIVHSAGTACKGHSRFANHLDTVGACIRLGYYAALNGCMAFKLPLPSHFNRRWKLLCVEALALGMSLGRSTTGAVA